MSVLTSLRRDDLLGYGFAFGSAVSYSVAQILTRHSVTDLAPSLLGSALALFWGTVAFTAIAAGSMNQQHPSFRLGALAFIGAGFFSFVGVLALFLALEREKVVVVSPISSTHPLFTLLLAAIFLRGTERVTRELLLGSLLVVVGIAVLALSR